MTEPSTHASAPSPSLPEHAKVALAIADLAARIGELRRHL
jgi:hypothetical protein